jgi:hypothetical protein
VLVRHDDLRQAHRVRRAEIDAYLPLIKVDYESVIRALATRAVTRKLRLASHTLLKNALRKSPTSSLSPRENPASGEFFVE